MKLRIADIKIDFAKKTFERDIVTASFSNYILLFLSLFLCVFSGYSIYQQVSLFNVGQSTEQKYSAHLHAIRKNSLADGKLSLSNEEVHAANRLIDRLNFPWSDFFDALEEAETVGVSLISLDAYSEKNSVNLIAEAKNQEAIFEYAGNIKQSELFDSVRLIQTELNQNTPQKPIKFHLELKWHR